MVGISNRIMIYKEQTSVGFYRPIGTRLELYSDVAPSWFQRKMLKLILNIEWTDVPVVKEV